MTSVDGHKDSARGESDEARDGGGEATFMIGFARAGPVADGLLAPIVCGLVKLLLNVARRIGWSRLACGGFL